MAEFDSGTPEFYEKQKGHDYGVPIQNTQSALRNQELQSAARITSETHRAENDAYIQKMKVRLSSLPTEKMEELLFEALSLINDIEEGRMEHQENPYLEARIFRELIAERKDNQSQ